MNNFYVYVYCLPDWTPLYVGKGHGRRYKRHLHTDSLYDGTYFHKKLLKLISSGVEFKIVRLFESLTETGAFNWERGLIAGFGRKNNKTGILYNLTDGGDGCSGYIHSEAARKTLSQKALKRYSNPVTRKEQGFKVKEYYSLNPQACELQRQGSCKQWANPLHRKTKTQGIRKYYVTKRVAAFGEFWYIVDLYKKFNIKYHALYQRIQAGVAPTWACLLPHYRGIPDYCKPKHITRIFGERPNAEAFDYIYEENLNA